MCAINSRFTRKQILLKMSEEENIPASVKPEIDSCPSTEVPAVTQVTNVEPEPQDIALADPPVEDHVEKTPDQVVDTPSSESMDDIAASDEEVEQVQVVVDYEKLFQRFVSSVALKDFKESSLTPEHRELIKDFLSSTEAKKLLFYIDDTAKDHILCLSTSLPPKPFDEMAYFIKDITDYDEPLTETNFETKVQFGKLTKNTMESLLNVMSNVYVPVFLGNKKWPDSVRKEFNSQLHKFMVVFIN